MGSHQTPKRRLFRVVRGACVVHLLCVLFLWCVRAVLRSILGWVTQIAATIESSRRFALISNHKGEQSMRVDGLRAARSVTTHPISLGNNSNRILQGQATPLYACMAPWVAPHYQPHGLRLAGQCSRADSHSTCQLAPMISSSTPTGPTLLHARRMPLFGKKKAAAAVEGTDGGASLTGETPSHTSGGGAMSTTSDKGANPFLTRTCHRVSPTCCLCCSFCSLFFNTHTQRH